MNSLRAAELVATEPQLRQLPVPTLVAWGTDDVFFHPRWATWLQATLPDCDLSWIDGGRLFFPDERAADLARVMLPYWHAHRR